MIPNYDPENFKDISGKLHIENPVSFYSFELAVMLRVLTNTFSAVPLFSQPTSMLRAHIHFSKFLFPKAKVTCTSQDQLVFKHIFARKAKALQMG